MYYEAIFQPNEGMEYKSESKKFIGKKIALQDGWVIDNGPFKGQNCYYIPNSTIGMIPMEDLQDLKPVSFVKWRELHNKMELS